MAREVAIGRLRAVGADCFGAGASSVAIWTVGGSKLGEPLTLALNRQLMFRRIHVAPQGLAFDF